MTVIHKSETKKSRKTKCLCHVDKGSGLWVDNPECPFHGHLAKAQALRLKLWNEGKAKNGD